MRGQHRNFHIFAFVDYLRDFFHITGLGSQDGRHVFHRVVCLHVSRLISDPAITRRVRLVETVGLKRFEKFPEIFGKFFCLAVLNDTLGKFFALRRHFRRNFFAHRIAEFIRFFPIVTSQFQSAGQQVILIHNQTIRFTQEFFHPGIQIFHQFRVVFAFDVFRNCFHGSGTIQRYHGVDIVDRGRFQFFEISSHAGAV